MVLYLILGAGPTRKLFASRGKPRAEVSRANLNADQAADLILQACLVVAVECRQDELATSSEYATMSLELRLVLLGMLTGLL